MTNNMYKYKILWIDDECKDFEFFIADANINNIILTPFKSLNAGIEELEKNYALYDGILLDAKFFENEQDQTGSEDTDYVHRAKEAILRLESSKKFEIFIFTGQAEAYEDKTFNKAFPKVYRKGIDKDTERLFQDLKEAANKQEDTQLRFEYKKVFDVCNDKYLGQIIEKDILDLLKLNGLDNVNNYYNLVRQVLENIFRAFNKHKLLPDEFINGTVHLNPSSKFLAGKKDKKNTSLLRKFEHHSSTYLPEHIANTIHNILQVVQSASHPSDITSYVKNNNTHYLFKSTLFQLLHIIEWFKIYIDSKPKTNNWKTKP